MSGTISSPTIAIRVDGAPAQSGVQGVQSALQSMMQSVRNAGAANDNLNATIQRMSQQMASSATSAGSASAALNQVRSGSAGAATGLHGVGDAAEHANGGLLGMIEHAAAATVAIAGLSFLAGGIHELVDAFVEASDEATEVSSRLAAVTKGAADLATAQAQVAAVANATRQPMEAVAELYQKIGIQADHLGLSQAQVGVATKVFSETLKIAGATTQQAQGSMRQLGEAFDIGKLSGIHYQAMMADNIVFMRALAQSMGVPIGKMKELSTQGKVTAADLKKALTDPTIISQMEKQFGRMPVSFADVRTGIHNSLVQLAGDFAGGAGLNTSLANLYAQIAQFGDRAKPTFEQIGVAVRAAFTAIAPAASAAVAAIKPVFAFVLDNAPALISLVKVAAEAWLAYEAATLAVKAVSLASTFATELQFIGLVAKEVLTGASSFSELAKALKLTEIAQIAFNAVAELNPYVAAATAIVTVVGLLYEFRDAINLGGGTMASFGDLCRATWDDIKGGVSAAWEEIESVTSTVFDAIKSAVSSVASYLGPIWTVPINTIKSLWNGMFGDLSLDLAGLLEGAARVADGMVGVFRGTVNTIVALFRDVPGLIASGDWSKVASTLSSSFASGFGHTAENAVKGLVAQAGKIGAARIAAQKKTPDAPGAIQAGHAVESDGPDAKALKAAQELAKKMADFWAGLKNGINSEQAYGQQLEINNKIFEYRKIVGDKITQGDKDRIANAIKEKDLNTAIAKLKESTANQSLANDQTSNRNAYTDAQQQHVNAIAAAATAGKSGMDALVSRAQALEDAQKQAAADLRVYDDVQAKQLADAQKGVDITTATYQAALKLYEVEVRRGDNLKHINDDLGKGQALIDKYDPTTVKANEKSGYLDNIKSIQLDAKNGTVDGDAAKRAISAINDEIYKLDHSMQSQWGDAIDQLGQQISGKWGNAISGVGKLLQNLVKGGSGDLSGFGGIGQVVKALGTNSDGTTNAFGTGVQDSMKKTLTSVFSGSTWTKPFDSISTNFKSFQGDVGSIFGKGGDLNKSLGAIGDIAGKGLAGAQTGDTADGIMKSLGLKSSKMGAEIGGAIGGAVAGPIGSVIGSIGGGLIGGLFKAAKKGGTTISYGANGVASTNTFGNSTSMENNSSSAATSVISGIQSAASQLGALFSGTNTGITIGQYKGNWRVNTVSTKLGGSSSPVAGLTDYGDDEQAAVTAAIKAALDKGVLSGLDEMTQKIIQTNDDLDTALAIAKSWQTVAVDQKFAGQGIQDQLVQQDALNKSLNTLRQQLEAAGAGAVDMATFYAYAQEQAAKGLKDLLSPLKSLQDTLDGSGSGVTSLNQLNSKLATLSQYEATLQGGGTIDTSDFTDLVQSILSLEGDVYGTASSQFQSARDRLNAANALEMQNSTQAYNDNLTDAAKQSAATTDAVNTQTNVLAAKNDQMISLLTTINNTIATTGTTSVVSVSGVNGAQTTRV